MLRYAEHKDRLPGGAGDTLTRTLDGIWCSRIQLIR